MDSNKNRVEIRKSEIIRNMNLTGSTDSKGELIYIEEFKERLQKGEKFLTMQQIENFNTDITEKILKAYTPEEKDEIRKSADVELAKLKQINVVTENGSKQTFFSISE